MSWLVIRVVWELLLIIVLLKRYLRATKWNSADVAIERLEGTLKWRREFGVYDLTAEHVEPEVRFSQTLQFALPSFHPRAYGEYFAKKAVTGKMFTFGYDTHR